MQMPFAFTFELADQIHFNASGETKAEIHHTQRSEILRNAKQVRWIVPQKFWLLSTDH